MAKRINDISVITHPYALAKGKKKKYVMRLSPANAALDNAAVCRSASNRGGLSIREETLQYAVRVYFEELAHLLSNGFTIANGYFSAQATIKGEVDTPDAHFNRRKQQIEFNFQQGVALRKMADTIDVKNMGAANRRSIWSATDVTTGSVNRLLTPGGMLIIGGWKLKLVGSDPSVGVYFTSVLTGEVCKVPANTIAENHPLRLILIIPDLPAGEYSLSLTTQYVGRSTPTKTPVTTALYPPLAVLDDASLSATLETLTRTGQASRPELVSLPDSSGSDSLTGMGQEGMYAEDGDII
jgi:hypothetical protein